MASLLPVLVFLAGACSIAFLVEVIKGAADTRWSEHARAWYLRLWALAVAQVLALVIWVPGIQYGLLPDSPRTWVVAAACVCAASSDYLYRWAKSLAPGVLETLQRRILAWVGGGRGNR